MAMVKTIEHGIQYALDNPGPDTHRQLLCYAALDMSPGHVLRDRREQPQWYSQRAQAAVAEVMPAAGTSAIVDTTTLVNAFCVLNDREPVESLPPGALFDVATFISACVFEDHVLFLSNRRVSSRDVASLLPGSSVRELPWGNESDFALIVGMPGVKPNGMRRHSSTTPTGKTSSLSIGAVW
jgi:hypothetical protein